MIKNLKNKKKKKAFTLIELIIVIAIIAILSAIALPKFGDVRRKANISADIANAKQIQSAVSMVIAEGDGSLKESSFTLDGGAKETTDPNGIEEKTKEQLQGALPKLKAEDKDSYFKVEVSSTGVVKIRTGGTSNKAIYPVGDSPYNQ